MAVRFCFWSLAHEMALDSTLFFCLCCWITLRQFISAVPLTRTNFRWKRSDVTTECGSAPPRIFSIRVINGTDASVGDWPWMAALIDEKGLFCGGTLIKDQFILTAAHCVKNRNPTDFTVTLGLEKVSQPNPEAVKYTVKSIITHPDYRRILLLNDIAIIKLNERVKLTKDIHSACLPSKSLSPEERFGYVTGWGHTENGGKPSDILQEVNFTIWKNEDCSKALNVKLEQHQMCAGVQDGSKDSCQGDSGGPLVINIGGKWIVSGVVSGGFECGRAGKPGVYTKVSSFNKWIKDSIYSNLRVGCPDGFKNFDESTCINEYYLEQYKKGALTWGQVLDRRQTNERLPPMRTGQQKCPSGHVEFDEFNCLTNFLYDRYQSRKENWNSLIGFLKNKATLISPSSTKIVSGKTEPPAVTPKFVLDSTRQKINSVSCSTTAAAKQGLAQVEFDEFYCISPDYLNGFKSGEFDWYTMLSRRFEKNP